MAIYQSSQFGAKKNKEGQEPSASMVNNVQYSFKKDYNAANFPPNTNTIDTTVSASGHLFQQTSYEKDKMSITYNQGKYNGATSTEV